MLYMSCPTCNYFLGQKILLYESDKQIICSNAELSKEEKEIEISKLLLKLKLKRGCCKMRVMSYKDIVQDILPLYT